MTSHTAPAAVSDLVMAERSSMHLSTGHAVHTAIAATTQHYDRSDQRSHHFIICLHTWYGCLLYTSPSPRDRTRSRMPSSA